MFFEKTDQHEGHDDQHDVNNPLFIQSGSIRMIVFANFSALSRCARPNAGRRYSSPRPGTSAPGTQRPADGQESGSSIPICAGRRDSRAVLGLLSDGPQSCRNEVGRIADGVFSGQFGDSPATATTSATRYRTVGRGDRPDQPAGVFSGR